MTSSLPALKVKSVMGGKIAQVYLFIMDTECLFIKDTVFG